MAQELGIVKLVSGSVRATAADGTTRVLQAGDKVFDTDILATAAGSAIVIQLADGSTVDMGGNDRMQLGAVLQEQEREEAVVVQNPPPAGPSVEDIQAALLAGADPTQIADPTAAGAPAAGAAGGVAGNEGHVPVSVDYLNPVAPVTNGFDTTGPSVAFNNIVPEVLLLNPGTLPGAQITGGNLPPFAANDSVSGIPAGTPVTLDVLGNDNDPDGSLNPASVTIVGSGGPGQPLVVAGQGTWTVNPATGAITFTPAAGFTGDPTPISYTVADNLGLVSNPATVTVDYNRPPVAANDSASGIAAGTPVTLDVLGNDNDPDGSLNPASVTIVGSGGPGQPLVVAGQGTWTVNPATGAITFTPAAGFTGDPTPISYTVADNLGLVSNPATVTVDYNRPPVAANDSASGIAAGTPVTLDVLGNDNDPDGSLNPASVTIVGSGGPGQPLVVAGQGTWSVNPATGAITFTPAAGFTGDPTPISYTVADNLGLVSNPATVTVDYNRPPVAANDSASGIAAGTPVTLDVLGNDNDPDGSLNPASVTIVGSGGPGQPLVVAGQGTWTVNPATGAITFTPAAGFTGDPTPISYTVADNLGLVSNPATVTVDYNRPPVAANDSASGIAAGTPVTLDVLGNDNDPDGSLNPASVTIVGSGGPGQPLVVAGQGTWTVNPATGAITFTPAAGFTGDPTPISYTVADNLGLVSNPATVTVDYNRPPVAANDSASGIAAGTPVTLDVLGNDNDPDGSLNPASVTIVGSGGPGQPLVVAGQGTWSVNPATGAITFTPAAGFTDDPTPISYTVADNLGLVSNPATVTVDYNRPPVAANDSASGIAAGTPVTLDVLGNDNDPDGSLNPASVTIVGSGGPGQPLVVAGQGTWTVNPATGAITFTPAAGFTGDPTPISYTVADNLGLVSNPATVTVDYNRPPVAANDSASGIAAGTPVTLDVLGNDNDPDGSLNPASVTIVGSGGPGQPLVVAGQGTWTVNPATGAITFTPAAGFTGDPTPISYTVADNLGLVSNPATVTVDYNRPPVAANDSASGIAAGTPVTLDVLGNDNDPDGSLNPASVTIVGSGGPGQPLVVAGQGTWSVNPATGAITFTPAAGFTGDPTPISYTVADNLGLVSNPATVTVDYNRPPVAANDSASGIAAGTPVTLDVLGNDNDPDGSLNPASVTIVGSGGPGQPLVVAGQGTWTVNPATGAITFTPAAGFTGDPTPISYTVADNLGLVSNPATVTVDYNRPPVAANDSASGIAAGTPVTLDVLGNDNDPDGSLNPASVTIVGSGGPGQPLVVAGQGTWTVNPATGAITFTPAAGFTGDPTPISYTVADNLGLVSNPATVTVDYNRPPVAANDSASGIAAGTPVTLDVLGNDNDPDGSLNPASVTIVGSGGPGQPLVVAGQGTWTVNPATGAITFTPAAGFTGDPTPISYTVADNLGLVSNPATVTVDYIPTVVATNAVVDETNGNLDQTGGAVLVEPTGSGSLLIDGQPPVSVTLAATGATWDAASKTLDASTYRITVNADGSYEFALKGALSHPGAADAASAPIQYDISAVLTGTNGEVANAVFRVDVYDDGPRVANSNGQVQNVAQPDQVLSGLIDYDLGFDGFGASGGVTLVNNNGALTSRGDSISYLVFDSNGDNLQEIYAFVDKGGLTTEANYLDQKSIDRAVFSLEPTEPGSVDGAYKLVLYDVLDIPAPTPTTLTFENATSVSASQIAFGSSLVVQGSNLVLSPANHIGVNDNALDRGETLTFKFGGVVNAVQMNDINADLAGPDRFSWTAYKDGAVVGSRNNVTMPSGGFTPAINVNGGFDTLKIDITAGKFELGGLKYQAASSQTLQLNFGFTATDGDGDSVSGSFSVNAGTLLATGITTTLPELQHADSHVH